MNIQQVGLRDGQILLCCVCLKWCRPIWADLDGPAFKAYYCYAHIPVQEETSMSTLTMRSKIMVRWTTAPSDMGYGGNPTGWHEGAGEIMSLRRAANFAHELSNQIGQGTYRLIEYRHKGRIIDLSEIHEVIAESEYRQMQRR